MEQSLTVFQKNNEVHAQLAELNNLLDKQPSAKWIATRNIGGQQIGYIPIGQIEQLLRTYFGAYQVEMIGQPQLMANSVVVSVHLKVFNPIVGQWFTYAGIGAVPIQLNKDANPTDFTQIKHDALHKNAPAAKSFAISNAAKSIGRVFGSELNRDLTSEFYDIYN